VSVRPALVHAATRAQIELESELVRLALRAAEHHPILKAVYAGPLEWLDEARRDPGKPEDLIVHARDLVSRAEKEDQPYVAGQARSVAVQLEVRQGRALPYDRMVAELLGVELEVPDPAEVSALRAEVEELAGRLEPTASSDRVQHWEAARLVSGEAKWDIAIETYVRGRRFAFGAVSRWRSTKSCSSFALPRSCGR
jgi:hypothetical protein